MPSPFLQHLDLTQHKLIYEGPLIHKKQPREQLHGLLFETMVVLLHKQVYFDTTEESSVRSEHSFVYGLSFYF